MSSRSQSDVIGVVLLTAIVTLTVTATGGIALTEWQSDIGDEPLADIESTMSDDTLTLEHAGGSELNASDVRVQIDNGDATYSLTAFDGIDDTFAGGMRIEKTDLETRAGGVRLRVIHEPSNTVLHDRLHDLGFRFLIGGKSGSVFMIPDTPVGYSAPDDASVTSDDDSVVTVDEPNENVTGLVTGDSATVEATDYTNTKTVDVQVIDRDQLTVETLHVNVTGGVTVDTEGELTDLGTLDETDLYIRYRKQRPVEFKGGPENNSDSVIADGVYFEDLDAYGHSDSGYVHDNTPLLPGTTRSYTYTANDDLYLGGALRDTEWTSSGTFGYDDHIDETDYRAELRYPAPTDEPFDLTVEYADNGEEMDVYLDGTQVKHWDGLGSYDELYFSSYQGGGYDHDPKDRILLVSKPGLGAPQDKLVRPGVEAPTVYSGSVMGLDPSTVYFVEAYTERPIANAVINASGDMMAVETEALVETLTPTNVTAESVRARGELTTSFGDSDLSFVVARADTGSIVAEQTVETGVGTPQQFSTTISELAPNTSYIYYASVEDTASTGRTVTDVGDNVSFTTDKPVVRTLDAEAAGGDTANVTGRLVDLGGLDETELYVRYRKQRPVEFKGGPENNSDSVIADGMHFEDLDAYGHSDNGYIHDNTPLLPGTTRSYTYTANDDLYLGGTLRDIEWTSSSTLGYDDVIDEADDRDRLTYPAPTDEPFELTVEYSDDGEDVDVYLDGTHVKHWSVGAYEELYFSSYQGGGYDHDPKDRILLVSKPGLGSPQDELIESGVEAPTEYSGKIADLDPDSVYFAEAYTEETVGGQIINASGEPMAIHTDSIVETRTPNAITAESVRLRGNLSSSLGDTDLSFVMARADDGTIVAEETVDTGVGTPQQFNTTVSGLQQDTDYVYYAVAEDTDSTGEPVSDTGENVTFTTDTPVVETVETESTGTQTANVTGRLVDLGGIDETDLYIRYREQHPVEFNGDPRNNSDTVIADGQYFEDLDAYGHDHSGHIHDNTPLLPGTTRTYTYTANDDLYLGGTLRTIEWTSSSTLGYYDVIDEADDRDRLTYPAPTDEPFELTVEYTDDSEDVYVYLDGAQVKHWPVEDYDELYFSSYQGGGYYTDPKDRILLVSKPGLGSPQYERVRTNDTVPDSYTGGLTSLNASTVYFAEAHTSTTINDQFINATGETQVVQTDDP